jgi:hypothetical protein
VTRPQYGLGRVKQHDPRSIHYSVPAWPRWAVKAVDWTRRAPIFDQGQLGSCTCNAAAGLVATDAVGYTGASSVTLSGNVLPVDETFALQVYSLATQLDEFQGAYPPDDTGSSGIGAAKALVQLGLSSLYQHVFSLEALNTALQRGPVMIGINWYESMFDTDANGVVKVNRRSSLAGGHEFVVSAYLPSSGLYRMDNSWGPGWGIGGSAFFKSADLQWLLSQDGDVTQPVLTAPVPPEPVPVPPVPGDADAVFWVQAQEWAASKGLN